MNRKKILSSLFIFSSIVVNAQWSTSPTQNNPVSLASQGQEFPKAASDGSGGAIICWRDFRSQTSLDIYAQHLSSSGNATWTPNGIPVCVVTGDQYDPNIISDGNGGAIIAWTDARGGNNYSGLYVQKIDASGNLLWPTNGVEITMDSVVSEAPNMISDGAGGVFITWEDIRKEGGVTGDIYAQHIDASGNIKWAARGVVICNASSDQQSPGIVSDNAGGAIIIWEDGRQPMDINVYAQRINSAGVIQWTGNGIPVSSSADHDRSPKAISDGNGGAIISWLDGSNSFIAAQKINSAGEIQWNSAGLSITGNYYNYKLQLCTDGSGGAIIAWESLSTPVSAQRVNSTGTIEWPNPVTVSDSVFTQEKPQLVSDNDGGAIIVWQDQRNGFFNMQIMAQHLNASGQRMWDIDGIDVSATTYDVNDYDYRQEPQILATGSGEAIVFWSDYRNGGGQKDIYAQLLGAGAIAPAIVTSLNEISMTQLNAYPNPASNQNTITLVLGSSSTVNITLVNALGQTESVLLQENLAAGNYNVNWDASKLASGLYFLQLQSNEAITVKSILIQH
ncbi:MAG: T9SS type A sorting domain-containing protein [Flavobacteriales bacterium]